MCAAKFERTGFMLRNVWPSVKQQSTTITQEQSGAFIRKNSGKSAAAATASGPPRTAPPPVQQPSTTFPGRTVRQQRPRLGPGPRHVASEFLRAQAGLKHAKSFTSVAHVATQEQPESFVPSAASLPRDDRARTGISIDELMRIASEKYVLNSDFWGKYTDIPSMAQATNKEDILQITENFALIHRKHVYLFQRIKNTVIKNLPLWSAPDLAALCHAWAQLGFLHEDLCLAMAERVTSTAHFCTVQELCWLMDAYATARCSVRSVTEEIIKQTLSSLDDFTLQQLCLHASSFARLNIHNERLFRAMATRFVQCSKEDEGFSARDLTLAAYSFAKLGFFFPEVFGAISVHSQEVIRDFTARDLQMLLVAFARAQYHNSDLLSAVSLQAQRRIAQFSAESLTLMLRSLAFFGMKDSGLFTRAVAQLPRTITTFRPADVTTLLSTFAAAQVHSESLFDIVTPFILEKATMFTPADWISALRSYSSLGHQDTMFLYAMTLHLKASRLSLRQLSTVMVDCSRLSFAGHAEQLAEAAGVRLQEETSGATPCQTEVVAQMYTALLLLGQTSPQRSLVRPPPGLSTAVSSLAHDISGHLSSSSDMWEALSPATCVSLSYAILLSPPAQGHERHPVSTAALVERAVANTESLSPEERLLLRQVLRVLELAPWNRFALKNASAAAGLVDAEIELDSSGPPGLQSQCESDGPPAAFSHTALCHLVPLMPSVGDIAPSPAVCQGNSDSFSACEGPAQEVRRPRWRGIFIANEIHRGLEEMSTALSEMGIENRVMADSGAEAHILLRAHEVRSLLPEATLSGERDIALVWGSTVHYTSGSGPEEVVHPRLSPSAKFQVTWLQTMRDVEVVVVPHWWWRCCDKTAGAGQSLAAFIASGGQLPSVQSLMPATEAARLTPSSCIE